jgi:hypothetical protein
MTPMEQSRYESEFNEMLKSKELEQRNSAYLVEVKLKTPDLKKKFKLEIYCQADSMSFYSPGFMGKGTFKGIVYGDSLRFYLPSEKAFYEGLWYDLTEPDLKHWKDLFMMTIDLFNGKLSPANDAKAPNRCYDNNYDLSGQNKNWCWNYKLNKKKLVKAQFKWWEPMWSGEPSVVINLKTVNRRIDFPYFNIKHTIIEAWQWTAMDSSKKATKSTIKIDFIRQKYNIDIPREKFELYIPASAERLEGLILE